MHPGGKIFNDFKIRLEVFLLILSSIIPSPQFFLLPSSILFVLMLFQLRPLQTIPTHSACKFYKTINIARIISKWLWFSLAWSRDSFFLLLKIIFCWLCVFCLPISYFLICILKVHTFLIFSRSRPCSHFSGRLTARLPSRDVCFTPYFFLFFCPPRSFSFLLLCRLCASFCRKLKFPTDCSH